MKRTIVVAALVAVVSVAAPAVQATSRHQARIAAPVIQDRYCLQGRTYGYPGDCGFSTYEQCRATASGTDAGCGINPAAAYDRQRPGYY